MRTSFAWLISAGSNSLNIAFGIATGVLVARLMGPEGRGELAEVLYWAGLIASLGICALPAAVTNRIARGDATDQTSVSALLLAFLLAGGSVIVGIFFVLLFASENLAALTALYVALFVPVNFAGLVMLGIDHGHQRFVRYNILRLMPQGIYLLGAVALWVAGSLTLSGLLMALWLGSTLVALIRLSASWRDLGLTPSNLEIRSLACKGLSYHTNALAGIAFQNADRLILIVLFTHVDLGFYAVALTLSAAGLGIVSTATATVLFPKLSGAKAPEVQRAQARNALGATFLLSLGINGAMALAAPLILPLLFGPTFAPAVPLAIVLCLAQVPASMAQLSIVALRAVDDWRAGPYSQLLALAIFLPAAFALGSQFDTLGVALALIGAHLGAVVLLMFRLRASFDLQFSAFLLPEAAWMRMQFCRLRN